ncbi:MAG: NUDIX domain-containing protein [Bacteroidota bacterium]
MLKQKLIQGLSAFYPTDAFSRKYPVSVKGVVLIEEKVVLLKNVRDEWELPGGKLDKGESPETCVVREIDEELDLVVRAPQIIDSWVYRIQDRVDVVIITYLCHHSYHNPKAIHISHEHKEVRLFSKGEVPNLNMPKGYKSSIERVFRMEG